MVRLALVFLALVGVCAHEVWGAGEGHVSPVKQCPGQNIEGLKQMVTVSPCGKTKCKLRKGKDATVAIRFKPKNEIKDLTTLVSANILGADLPFIGVTGTSACGKITLAESGEVAPCPLKPDVEYIYKQSFHIEDFYPEISLTVHWSLNKGGEDVICFEVPAEIKK